MRPLVIPCSGAAGHHRRFHTAAATSKKFPFSTFYVLIHHYCYSPPNVDSLFLAGLRHGVGIGGSPLARFGLYWWWWWGPKGHSLLLLLTLWWPLAGPNGNLTHFFSSFFLLLGRGRFGGWRSSWSCDCCSCCCCWRSLFPSPCSAKSKMCTIHCCVYSATLYYCALNHAQGVFGLQLDHHFFASCLKTRIHYRSQLLFHYSCAHQRRHRKPAKLIPFNNYLHSLTLHSFNALAAATTSTPLSAGNTSSPC